MRELLLKVVKGKQTPEKKVLLITKLLEDESKWTIKKAKPKYVIHKMKNGEFYKEYPYSSLEKIFTQNLGDVDRSKFNELKENFKKGVEITLTKTTNNVFTLKRVQKEKGE